MNGTMLMSWGQKSVFFQGIYFSEERNSTERKVSKDGDEKLKNWEIFIFISFQVFFSYINNVYSITIMKVLNTVTCIPVSKTPFYLLPRTTKI